MECQPPLHGIQVIEIAGWNGVLAGRLLADGGADVVRIVPPTGDPLEAEPPYFATSGVSIQEAWYNAGKRTVALDLAAPAGRGQLRAMLEGCDILIEDWAPGQALLSATDVEAAGVAVHLSVTSFGQQGPWAHYRTNDLVANALSGSASVTGDATTPPLSGYGNQSHHTVGFFAAICALAALRAAGAGKGHQRVDLSAHEALVSCTEQVLMQWFFPEAGNWTTRVAERMGSLHWSKAYEVYTGRDGKGIMVTASLRLADVLVPWLAEDGFAQDLVDGEKYPDAVALVRDLPNVMRVLREWVEANNAEDLFYEAQRRHLPFGVVWDIATAAQSPQVAARGYFQERDLAGLGPVPFPGRFFRTGADGPHPAPPVRMEVNDLAWGPRKALQRTGPAPASARPLEGVRVMDFTHVLAGPYGTRVLGDLGADILKVGSATRGAGANSSGHPYYMMWNRNKRSISLNMTTSEGRMLARRLASKCDIIIENFRAGVLARWGLDRASLAHDNPGVSVITMGGVGQTGPWKDFVTFAPTIHALVGLTYLTGVPGRHDIGYGFSLNDHMSGLAGAFAAMEALAHRERTGEGLEIDLSQYEVGLGLMAPAYLDYFANGRNPKPLGNAHPFGGWAPHSIYPAAGEDRWVAIAVRGDHEWAALCQAMGMPTLATDARFADHEGRLANAAALDAIISAWTRERDRYEVMDTLQRAGIAAGAVQDAADLAERDPQLREAQFFGTARSERWQDYGIERLPAHFNGERPSPYEGTREAGADTFDVLREVLGMSEHEIAEAAAADALL